jgi:eukaryotic-like serine/threonine-protein kinase
MGGGVAAVSSTERIGTSRMLKERGSALGKYQLIAEIARGGMGVVYLALVQGPGGFHKLAVVKELKPELVEEPTFLTMFLDEARLAARLSHPNIVQTNEVGNDGDRYFLAMEYLDGRCLDHIRRRAKAASQIVPPSMQLRILSEMLAGLDYAHRLADFDGTPLNIVHRDVSPQNVFVTFSGHVKLLDFGIAKAADSSHDTNAGILKGKVAYMSPEQARGLKVDARADVFAAGVMLWEAVTGARLWGRQTDEEKLWSLVAGNLPRASSINPAVPRELDEICARAMAWSRDDRYQTAGQFQRDLEQYLAVAGSVVGAAELGAHVAALYREDRMRANALIDAYVSRARSGALRGELPIMDIAPRSTSGGTRQGRPATSAQFAPAEPEESPSGQSANIAVAAPSGQSKFGPRRRMPLIVTACSAAITLAIGGVIALGSDDDAPQAAHFEAAPPPVEHAPPPIQPAPPPVQPAPPPEPTPPAAALPPPRPEVVRVEIRATPGSATLWIDDAELAGNPFGGNYRKDNDVHHVRASAPGYVTKIVAITFDANTKLDLSLERLEPPAPRSPPPAASSARTQQAPQVRAAPAMPETPRAPDPSPAPPSPPARAPIEVDPAGGKKPLRAIDPTNPYGSAAGRAIDPSNPYSGAP